MMQGCSFGRRALATLSMEAQDEADKWLTIPTCRLRGAVVGWKRADLLSAPCARRDGRIRRSMGRLSVQLHAQPRIRLLSREAQDTLPTPGARSKLRAWGGILRRARLGRMHICFNRLGGGASRPETRRHQMGKALPGAQTTSSNSHPAVLLMQESSATTSSGRVL